MLSTYMACPLPHKDMANHAGRLAGLIASKTVSIDHPLGPSGLGGGRSTDVHARFVHTRHLSESSTEEARRVQRRRRVKALHLQKRKWQQGSHDQKSAVEHRYAFLPPLGIACTSDAEKRTAPPRPTNGRMDGKLMIWRVAEGVGPYCDHHARTLSLSSSSSPSPSSPGSPSLLGGPRQDRKEESA
jgi:hypothetical protein